MWMQIITSLMCFLSVQKKLQTWGLENKYLEMQMLWTAGEHLLSPFRLLENIILKKTPQLLMLIKNNG